MSHDPFQGRAPNNPTGVSPVAKWTREFDLPLPAQRPASHYDVNTPSSSSSTPHATTTAATFVPRTVMYAQPSDTAASSSSTSAAPLRSVGEPLVFRPTSTAGPSSSSSSSTTLPMSHHSPVKKGRPTIELGAVPRPSSVPVAAPAAAPPSSLALGEAGVKTSRERSQPPLPLPRGTSQPSLPLPMPGPASQNLPTHNNNNNNNHGYPNTASMAPSASTSSVARAPSAAPPATIDSTSSAKPLKPIDDASFFSDILFMWTGVERTRYWMYHPASMTYIPANDRDGSARQRRAIQQLSPCGVYARSIDDALRRSTASSMSFLQQSLRSAIRRQLTMYFFFVSSIRERAYDLTMGDLIVAHKKAFPKLTLLHTLLTETSDAKGGELASRLERLLQQGSKRLSDLMQEIHTEAVSPLLMMTVEWITKGDASDPFHEFFVHVDHNVDMASDAVWNARYALDSHMVPTTITETVAERILLTGKNIAFIKQCCRDKDWKLEKSLVDAAQSCTFDTLPQVVSSILESTNKAVLQLVMGKLRLGSLLRVMHSFFLVANGDFFEGLVQRLDGTLSRPSTQVHPSVVVDQFQMALLDATSGPRASRSLDADLVQLLQCEVAKDDNLSGWDAFSLRLLISGPLSNILDHQTMKLYQRHFRFLFKVKRAEIALKQSWRQSILLDRQLVRKPVDHPETPLLHKIAGDAHSIGLQLVHFVNNVWSYLVSEVSMTAWERLWQTLSLCENIDEVIAAHKAYLQQLTMYCMLHGDCASIRQSIDNILFLAREYCAAQRLLTALLFENRGSIVSVSSEYQKIEDEFQQEITGLLQTLEDQRLPFDFLNFLLLRLNFNQFYRDTTQHGHNTDF